MIAVINPFPSLCQCLTALLENMKCEVLAAASLLVLRARLGTYFDVRSSLPYEHPLLRRTNVLMDRSFGWYWLRVRASACPSGQYHAPSCSPEGTSWRRSNQSLKRLILRCSPLSRSLDLRDHDALERFCDSGCLKQSQHRLFDSTTLGWVTMDHFLRANGSGLAPCCR